MDHTHCLTPSRRQSSEGARVLPSSYGRLFPELPLFAADDAFLFALGRAGPMRLPIGANEDASTGSEAAGWPFFGQFVAHDITADRSTLRRQVDPRELKNARTPRLDLGCLYGDGPIDHPFLFQRQDPAKLLLGTTGDDVRRNNEGTAISGDPRNDSHVFMSQMHLAFARAHNACVDAARTHGVPESQLFESASRKLRWHCQTVVTRELLPRLLHHHLTQQILAGDRLALRQRVPFIPLEFADAAYRYGHSQIRHHDQVNHRSTPVPLFPDLTGFKPFQQRGRVDWTMVFDVPGSPPAQRAKRVDGRIARSLIGLPVALTGTNEIEEFHSLAVRDLERGQGVRLPSGEAIAKALGERPLTREEIGMEHAGWRRETPLWYYILREADVREGGDRLGPVEGRIVGELLIGLLADDGLSVLHAPADWQPRSTLVELLTLDIDGP